MTGEYDEETVEKYLTAARSTDNDRVDVQVEALLNRLVERVKAVDKKWKWLDEVGNVKEALARFAEETGDPGAVIEHVDEYGNDYANDTGQKVSTGTITGDMLDKVRELDRETRAESGEEFEIDGDGIGFDRYLEEHLVRVVQLRNTDHVSNVTTRFEFDDGTEIECGEDHLYWEPFFRAVAPHTQIDSGVMREFASQQATTRIPDDAGDVTDTNSHAYSLYCKLSLGPEERPWSKNTDLWDKAIKDLIKEYGTETVSTGPRTEAWENLQGKIGAARATANLDDAVEHAEVYVDEDLDEVWVPTSMAATVVEDVEIDRQDLQMELAKRGVDSDHLSGDKLGFKVTRNGSFQRFWRFDATHEATPEPREVVDTISTGGASNIGGSSGTAAADGGTYGRDPTGDEDSDENRGDGE
ncbi:hypothetical protein [Natrinema versiforme]|uniref:Uncharacterized protein n=1 Tax=Natrinema versiforme TaxID=88724 RepID=A0A4V1G003_9EURY|nr:hypothetical protein [Natrinema versiforme]QCS43646.1 hypothetical protein FEJ81_15285 [Natrinema versiforme]